MNNPELTRAAAHRAPHNDSPEWIKVSDAVRRFGIGRTSIYELIRSGSIKTALIRKHGNTLGSRLISTDSLRKFIERFIETPVSNDNLRGRPTSRRNTGGGKV